MKKYSIYILLIGFVLGGCEDFLDESPNKSSAVEISTVEHLDRLLNNYQAFYRQANSDLIYGSDDYELSVDFFDAYMGSYQASQAQYATWDVDRVPFDSRSYWPDEWQKVFTANVVLENVDQVSGSEEIKKELKAEAHLILAYSYYEMVNTFCLPYSSENMNEMGLPIKVSTNFQDDVTRASLGDTWNYILANLTEAQKLTKRLEYSDGIYHSYRASKEAVNAFSARVYLCMGDYSKAQEYAEAALALHDELMDYNTEMSTVGRSTYIFPDGVPTQVVIEFPHTVNNHSPLDRMKWSEHYYYRFLYNGSFDTWASADLVALYDQAYDLRYRYHIVEDYSYIRGAGNPPYSVPGYIFYSESDYPSGPSVAEMLIIKAECQVRLGQWNQGIATANLLRAVRMDNTAPASAINLSASSEAEALSIILDERRREMPFTQRFFDIRRFNNNDEPADDVMMSRTFYPVSDIIESGSSPINYTMDKKDRRFARPIPDIDLQSSKGAIKQNTY